MHWHALPPRRVIAVRNFVVNIGFSRSAKGSMKTPPTYAVRSDLHIIAITAVSSPRVWISRRQHTVNHNLPTTTAQETLYPITTVRCTCRRCVRPSVITLSLIDIHRSYCRCNISNILINIARAIWRHPSRHLWYNRSKRFSFFFPSSFRHRSNFFSRNFLAPLIRPSVVVHFRHEFLSPVTSDIITGCRLPVPRCKHFLLIYYKDGACSRNKQPVHPSSPPAVVCPLSA